VNVNGPSALYESTPCQDHQPHVDIMPSFPICNSSRSSSFPNEISIASNQVDKKKKNNLEGKLPTPAGHVGSDQTTIVHHAVSVDNVDKSIKTHHKPKLPCRICKSDHLLKDFLGIPKVVEVWYEGSQPTSSVAAGHVGDKPSTNDNHVGSKKGKFKFP
jgi:hypothetical protein